MSEKDLETGKDPEAKVDSGSNHGAAPTAAGTSAVIPGDGTPPPLDSARLSRFVTHPARKFCLIMNFSLYWRPQHSPRRGRACSDRPFEEEEGDLPLLESHSICVF